MNDLIDAGAKVIVEKLDTPQRKIYKRRKPKTVWVSSLEQIHKLREYKDTIELNN